MRKQKQKRHAQITEHGDKTEMGSAGLKIRKMQDKFNAFIVIINNTKRYNNLQS